MIHEFQSKKEACTNRLSFLAPSLNFQLENKKDTMSENNAANSLTKRFQDRAGQVNSMLKTMQEQKYKIFQTTPMTF